MVEKWKFEQDLQGFDIKLNDEQVLDLYAYIDGLVEDSLRSTSEENEDLQSTITKMKKEAGRVEKAYETKIEKLLEEIEDLRNDLEAYDGESYGRQ